MTLMRSPLDCPVSGCEAKRKPEHMMCLHHWRRVPKLLKAAIWDTFKEWSRAALGKGSDARRRYMQARHEAIRAVEIKEFDEAHRCSSSDLAAQL